MYNFVAVMLLIYEIYVTFKLVQNVDGTCTNDMCLIV